MTFHFFCLCVEKSQRWGVSVAEWWGRHEGLLRGQTESRGAGTGPGPTRRPRAQHLFSHGGPQSARASHTNHLRYPNRHSLCISLCLTVYFPVILKDICTRTKISCHYRTKSSQSSLSPSLSSQLLLAALLLLKSILMHESQPVTQTHLYENHNYETCFGF